MMNIISKICCPRRNNREAVVNQGHVSPQIQVQRNVVEHQHPDETVPLLQRQLSRPISIPNSAQIEQEYHDSPPRRPEDADREAHRKKFLSGELLKKTTANL